MYLFSSTSNFVLMQNLIRRIFRSLGFKYVIFKPYHEQNRIDFYIFIKCCNKRQKLIFIKLWKNLFYFYVFISRNIPNTQSSPFIFYSFIIVALSWFYIAQIHFYILNIFEFLVHFQKINLFLKYSNREMQFFLVLEFQS